MVKKVKKAVQKSKTENGMPLGVKIISVFTYVLSALLVIMSIFLFGAGALLNQTDAQQLIKMFVEDSTASTTVASDVTLGIFIGGVVFLIFGVLMYFVARNLWKGKNWARIVLVIFFGLGFVGALSDILMGSVLVNIPDLIIDGAIAGYLLFNNKVRVAFSK
ncbi:MAG TPA: hypothetical protein VHA12_00850 [Candidatus Nanoarchaeia archaeon]|nr:hypothetical protein [Candidatus Nanoarchaeia archaeon]